jgi:hypothetical protein
MIAVPNSFLFLMRPFLLPLASLIFVFALGAAQPAAARSYLVDFGSSQSFRGADAPSPDANGNHWNRIPRPSSQLNGLVDTAGQTNSLLSLGFSTPFGTDSFNGPAGATSNPPTAGEVDATDIDATALGPLGVKEAAFDYVATDLASGSDFRLAIQGLDPLLTYSLVLFGSRKFSTDSTTVYEAFTDPGYTLLAASARLDVHTPGSPWLHNRDKAATLANIKPSAGGAIYLRVRGANGSNGYLNALRIAEGVRPLDGRGIVYVGVRHPPSGRELVSPSDGTLEGFANPPLTSLRGHWHLASGADPSVVWIRNRISGEALRAATDTGSVAVVPWNQDDPRQQWKMETVATPGGAVTRFRINGTEAALTVGAEGQAPSVSAADPGNAAQDWILPELPRGAVVPWTSYDEDNLTLVTPPGGVIRLSYSEGPVALAAEAQKRGVILLNGFDTYVRWTASAPADVMTMRYSVADGNAGTITLRITDGAGAVTSRKVPLDSSQSWVYFDSQGIEHQSPAAGRTPAKRYAEARIKLAAILQPGDTIELRREAGDVMTWIDVIETEMAESIPAPDPAAWLNAKAAPYNAAGDGSANDTAALKNCITAAASEGKGVYLPAGAYRLEEEIYLPQGTRLQGAGMWRTELIFSRSSATAYAGQGLGGLAAGGGSTVVRDLYIKGAQTTRANGYKALKGTWGTGSLVENVWADQTEVGAWIADFSNNGDIYTDGLVLRNCRFRNTFADGVNYASGTRNSVVENCHVRGAGDDGVASWASGRNNNKPTTLNQQFRYNTIECGFRAGGIGVFGGEGHEIHHNVVRDQVAGPGIRLNTVFVYESGILKGYPFGSQLIQIYENTLERTGCLTIFNEQTGAIDLQTWYDDVKNIRFDQTTIATTRYQGIRFSKIGNVGGPAFGNILFTDSVISGAPLGTLVTSASAGTAAFDANTAAAGINNQSVNFVVTGPPPPPPVIASFTPSSALRGSTVTITGAHLGSTSLVQFGAQNAASFAVLDDNTVAAVVPSGAVDALLRVETAGGSDVSDTILVITQANAPPVIAPDLPASVALPTGLGLQLSATVTDDGLPSPAAVTTQWSVVSAPPGGEAVFDNSSSPSTGVRFDLIGSYVLRLTASDGELSSFADVTVAHGVPASGTAQDIGSVGAAGSSASSAGVWTLRGSGADIWDTADGFHFRYAALEGNGFIQARLLSQTWTHEWAKAGLMIRDDLSADSTHVLLAGTTGNGLALQNRPVAGGVTLHQALGTYSYGVWLRLVRTGATITAFRSADGVTWTQVGTALSPSMSGPVYVGLVVTSHNNGTLSTATFDNLEGSGFGAAAPTVSAGADVEVNAGQGVQITGTAGGAVSTEWLKASGPDALTIGSPAALQTSVLASAGGTYVLRLIVNNGSVRTFDEMTLTVQALTPDWAQWQATEFPDPLAESAAPGADPDRDGLANLLEFVMGLNPLASSSAPRIAAGPDRRIFSFHRRAGGSGSIVTEAGYVVGGVGCSVLCTASLAPASWQTGPGVLEEVGAPVDNGDGTETVRVRATAEAPSAFMALQVRMVDP